MSHQGHEEWISIGDLMAGVIPVVVLMFMVAALQSQLAAAENVEREQQEQRRKLELAATAAALRARGVVGALEAFSANVQRRGLGDVIEVDVAGRRILLQEATFRSGSACLSARVNAALQEQSAGLRELLMSSSEVEVVVEGHTDNEPVGRLPSRGYACALYDDNYTLSTARARQARQALITGWPAALTQRVALGGWGDSRPLPGSNPADSSNRRVEIKIEEGSRRPTPVDRPAAEP